MSNSEVYTFGVLCALVVVILTAIGSMLKNIKNRRKEKPAEPIVPIEPIITRPHLIAFTGKTGSGKSTAGEFLAKYYYIIDYFARPLKQISSILATGDIYDPRFHDPVDKEKPLPNCFDLTPRQIMQFVGTDICREQLVKLHPGFGNSLWINLFFKRYDPKSRTVVTDLRFLNEAEAIKKAGGIIIRIIRPTEAKGETSTHASETEMDKIKADYTIINDSDIETFYSNIDKLMLEISKPKTDESST